MKKKIAALVAVAMIFGCVIGGTIAWLTANSDTVTNTFTTSGIAIELKETEGTLNGQDREFKMVPGYTIAKDPTVTVKGGSEDCYLFVKVEKANDLDEYITYTVDIGDNKWKALDGVDGVYYREVAADSADQTFGVLKDDEVTVKGSVTKDDMVTAAQNQPTLTFTAYASQMYKANNGGEAGNEKVAFTATEAWANISNPTGATTENGGEATE